MDVETLSSLGLPGWFVVAAAAIFILRQVGLLDFVLARLKSQSQLEREQVEFERQQTEARAAAEQSEYIALWSQMTQLQTKTLDQAELLLEHVINDASDWKRDHSEKLSEIAERQYQLTTEIKHLSSKFTVMFGIIEQRYGKKEIDA